MKPELTEAEHYQVDDAPSPVIAWLGCAGLTGITLIATAIGLYLTQ